MDQQKQELIEKLRGANNVLVTVSSNPSVDQLAACIGITLFLNKMNKHGTAVFSGAVPSTIDFLKPEETLEKNTDSLRDFIIALDKSKADKLRYKVEQNVVKIFITPYKTSITSDDLDFSQGDFNVDVVLCLGVQQQQDLDQAITAHGRILHDAVVTSINTVNTVDLASINWINPNASSLSEMVIEVADALGKELIDGQIATAMLTGIVAETDRFSNEKTSPETMRLSAELMAAGANQQLVASELQAPLKTEEATTEAVTELENEGETLPPEAPVNQDGTLEIDHPEGEEPPADNTSYNPDTPDDQPPAGPGTDDGAHDSSEDTQPDEGGQAPELPPDQPESDEPLSRMMLQPPSMGGTLTANSLPEGNDPTVDPLTLATAADGHQETPTDEPDVLNYQDTSQSQPSLPAFNLDDSEAETAPADDAVQKSTDDAGKDEDVQSVDKATDSDEVPIEPTDTSAPESVADLEPLVLPEVSPEAAVDTPEDEEKTEEASITVPLENPVPDLPIISSTEAPQPTTEPTEISIDDNGNFQPSTSATGEPAAPETLADIEHAVEADAATSAEPPAAPEMVDDARDAVLSAINSMPTKLEPQESVGATGYLNVHDLPDEAEPISPSVAPPTPAAFPIEPPVLLDEPAASTTDSTVLPLPASLMPPPADPTPPTSVTTDAGAPPPVPPPIITDPTQFLKDQAA